MTPHVATAVNKHLRVISALADLLWHEGLTWAEAEKALHMPWGNGMSAWRAAKNKHKPGNRKKRTHNFSISDAKRDRVVRRVVRALKQIILNLREYGLSWRQIEVHLHLKRKRGWTAWNLAKTA